MKEKEERKRKEKKEKGKKEKNPSMRAANPFFLYSIRNSALFLSWEGRLRGARKGERKRGKGKGRGGEDKVRRHTLAAS